MFDNINRVKRSELSDDVQKDLLSADDHQKLNSLIIDPDGGGSTLSHHLDITVNATDFKYDGSKDVSILIDTTTLGAATADHEHPPQVNITGNAATANRFFAPVNIGNVSFDGSKSITLTDIGAASSSHTHDDKYAIKDHNHDDTYSLKTHNHDGVYSPADHNHDDDYAVKDHTHNYAASTSAGGAATSALKLNSKVKISLTGDAEGEIEFDGSEAVSIPTKVVNGGSITSYPASRFYTTEPLRSDTHRVKMTTVTGAPYSILFYNNASSEGLEPIKRYDNIPSGVEYELTDLPVNETWPLMYVIGDFLYMKYSMYPESKTVDDVKHVDAFCVTDIILGDMPFLYEVSSYEVGSHRQTRYLKTFKLGRNNITDMSEYFFGCVSIDYNSIRDLDTSEVINMNGMFKSTRIKTFPPLNTSNVTTMDGMFESSMIIATPEMDTSNVTSASGIFHSCYNLESILEYDFNNLKDCSNMFSYCEMIRKINLVLPNAVNLNSMFKNCSKLKSVSIVAKSELLDDCSSMFMDCISLTDIHICIPFAKNFNSFFETCTSIVEIPWMDTRNAITMENFCCDCISLKEFPLIETTKVKSFSNAFKNCTLLKYLPPLDTTNCINFNSMFRGCIGLVEIPKLDFSSAEDISYMFAKGDRSDISLKCHGEIILTNPALSSYTDFIHTNAEKGVRIGYLPECKAIAEDIVRILNYDKNAAYPHVVSYNVDQAIRITLPDIEKDETNPRVLAAMIKWSSWSDSDSPTSIYEIEGFNKYNKKVMGLSTTAVEYVEIFNNDIYRDGGDTIVKYLIIRSLRESNDIEIFAAPSIVFEELDMYKFKFDVLGPDNTEEYPYSLIGIDTIAEGEVPSSTGSIDDSKLSKINIHFSSSLFTCYDGYYYPVTEGFYGEIGHLNILKIKDVSRLFHSYYGETIPNLSFYHCTIGNELFWRSNLSSGLSKDFWHTTRNMLELNDMFGDSRIQEVELDLESCNSINRIFGTIYDSPTHGRRYSYIKKASLHNMKNITAIDSQEILQAYSLKELYMDGLENVTSLVNAVSYIPKLQKLALIGLTDKLTNIREMCNGLENLEEINMPGFSGKSLLNAERAFRRCIKLETLPELDMKNCTNLTAYAEGTLIEDITLDLSSCIEARYLFHDCIRLKSATLLNTSKVGNWEHMFSMSRIIKIPELDFSSCTDLNHMFYGCTDLEDEQELILNTTKLNLMPSTAFKNTFENCGTINGRLKNFIVRYPAIDLSTNIPVMNWKYISRFIEFGGANPNYNVFFIPNGSFANIAMGKCGSEDGSTWINTAADLSIYDEYTNFRDGTFEVYEFDSSLQFKRKITDFSQGYWFKKEDNIGGAVIIRLADVDMRTLVVQNTDIDTQPVSLNINVGDIKVSYKTGWFYSSRGLFTLEGENITTEPAKMMNGLGQSKVEQVYINIKSIEKYDYYASFFWNCSELRNVIIHTEEENFRTSSNPSISMYDIFSGCSKLMYVPDHIVKMSKFVNNLGNVFRACSSLKTIPMMDTSNVTDFSGSFMQCTSIEEVPNWDLSKATITEGMFYGCANLLRIPRYRLSSCLKTRQMFYGCYHLYDVPVWWDMPVVTNTEYMFSYCYCLEHPIVYSSKDITIANEMYSRCARLHGLVNFDSLGTFKDMFKDTYMPIIIQVQSTNSQGGSTAVPSNVTKTLINFRTNP